MQQAQEFIAGHTPGAGHRLPGLQKHIRYDGRRRHAAPFQQDPVEHTARAAGPSVPDAGVCPPARPEEIVARVDVRLAGE